MRVLDAYPLVTAPDPHACRDFYVRHFGASTAFEVDWFVLIELQGPEDGARPFSLAFMTSEHPSSPPGPEVFDGKGMILTIQVASAEAAHAALIASGAPILYGPAREPWGQHRFMTRDPSGTLVDVVEQIAPDPDFWAD